MNDWPVAGAFEGEASETEGDWNLKPIFDAMTCRSIKETLECKTFPDPAPFFDEIAESDIQLLDAAAEQLKDVDGLLENGEILPQIKTMFEPVNGDAPPLE